MSNRLVFFSLLIGAFLIVAMNSLFSLDEGEQALVLQFGDPKRVITEPGLKAKLPFVQNVIFYDKRILDSTPPVEQVILADQKRLDVDAYVRFKITNPLKFYQAVQTETVFYQRLNPTLNSALRGVLGSVNLSDLLSDKRAGIMTQIHEQVAKATELFGVEIIDVRIKRADLPQSTSEAIYARMRSEREREAAEFRAQGQEQAQQIKAKADRDRTVLIAEADKQAQILKGQGDQEALNIMANATQSSADFYGFYRSLEAYKKALNKDNTSFVISPKNDFFKYFNTKSASK